MNAQHLKILLEGCHNPSASSNNGNIKVIGMNGNSTQVNVCVLVYILPWLQKDLESKVNNLSSFLVIFYGERLNFMYNI